MSTYLLKLPYSALVIISCTRIRTKRAFTSIELCLSSFTLKTSIPILEYFLFKKKSRWEAYSGRPVFFPTYPENQCLSLNKFLCFEFMNPVMLDGEKGHR